MNERIHIIIRKFVGTNLLYDVYWTLKVNMNPKLGAISGNVGYCDIFVDRFPRGQHRPMLLLFAHVATIVQQSLPEMHAGVSTPTQ